MRKNPDNRERKNFGIQYHDIFNNLDAELEMSIIGLVVFTCEALENIPDKFSELSVKQIKAIVISAKLPFILCFKDSQTKVANEMIENAERNIILKKIMNALQDDLRKTHLIIKTEPLLGKPIFDKKQCNSNLSKMLIS